MEDKKIELTREFRKLRKGGSSRDVYWKKGRYTENSVKMKGRNSKRKSRRR